MASFGTLKPCFPSISNEILLVPVLISFCPTADDLLLKNKKGCVTLLCPKIAVLPGQTENWNCKSWEKALNESEMMGCWAEWYQNWHKRYFITYSWKLWFYCAKWCQNYRLRIKKRSGFLIIWAIKLLGLKTHILL